ncbi:MAG: triose-phosphate isomerase [Spiroplasma sp.]|nr:triose-phosphate isomerase [Mycoplasmatales bacterium]
MKKNVIAGNWKMNKTNSEGLQFVKEFISTGKTYDGIILIFPPIIMVKDMLNVTKDTNIEIGIQNIHQNEKGAYTGEVSALMAKNIGVEYVLVGHSERRQYYNETNLIVNQKAKKAISLDMTAIVCVGETLEERNAKVTNSILKSQVTKALNEISGEEMKKIIIAYEPVWAIGTGLTASADDANKACKYIREVISHLYSSTIANNVVIQYGGSVTPDSVEELIGQSDIDGALVGGASLDVESFSKLLV